eukprot:CAMPEP_0183406914 /NCGR_PEP_ID=MMETSP0370-20130417/16968_1 /TAXON_ID=268820 /ORGANISM="Peridinium aciculiferum, Strain PAER-2" /LENGTH=468 /DNA_ID=CAMNT_0025589193 /DNA_START=1 /DNA_END=1407 /DNA_ORIENTATION=+
MDETELVALRGAEGVASPSGSRDGVGPRAAGVIEAFYEDLRQEHLRQDHLRRQSDAFGSSSRNSHSRPSGGEAEAEAEADLEGGATPSAPSRSPTRFNQRRLYTDDERRQAAIDVSRRHLEEHQDWLFGPLALSAQELRARIALHHHVYVDVEDLGLPTGQRRSDDTFTEQGVSHQLLLDAGRSDFILPGGLELSFRQEVEATGTSLEQHSLEVEHMLRAFEDRLVTALLRCLGSGAPFVLVQAISRAMSQSGMANLERACQGPQIVVSGGEQSLRYELVQVSTRAWEVRTTLRKYRFEQFVVVDEAGLDEPAKVEVMESHLDSQILRSCAVLFEVLPDSDSAAEGRQGDSGVGLAVDVRGLVDRVELLDRSGRPIRLEVSELAGEDHSERGAWKAALGRRAVAFAQCFAAREPFRVYAGDMVSKAAARCRFCRRRARGAVDSAVQLPRRMVSGIEEGDACMRAPLRG